MALTDDDVIVALSDSVVRRMNFWVDSVHVRGEAYTKVATLIDDEQILVVSGSDPNRAWYDSASDTLTTQKASSPADLDNRGILIHECTHAIADMEHATITWRTNEAAARIAQAAYLLVSNPHHPIPPNHKYFLNGAIALVKQFGLDTNPGAGTRLRMDDVLSLIVRLDKEKAYHTDTTRMSMCNGVSKKDRKRIRLPKATEETTIEFTYSAKNAYRVPTDTLFDFGGHNIKPEAEPALREAAAYIANLLGPGQRVYITGHTDSKGDGASNVALSKRRADAVAQWLITRQLVDAARVVPDGKGESKPLAPNKRPDGSDDPVGRAKNRRVDVLIM